MDSPAVFTGADGRFHATEFARGPWDPGAQHGGAPAALLMRAFEGLPASDAVVIARVTYELLRPAPLGEVLVEAEVARRGRRVQLLEGSLRDADGTEIVRARALQVQRANGNAPATASETLPAGPESGRLHGPGSGGFSPPHRPMFAPDAIEIRFVEGIFGHGPSTAWFRLRIPIVAGEEPSPLQRLAAAGDFGNGISAVLPWDRYLFINPDLTLYLDRPPRGEWICLRASTTITAGGVGTAESVLYDADGRVGRAIQSLLIASR